MEFLNQTNCGCVFVCVGVCVLSHVRLFITLWTVALQAPLFMGFPRQEYRIGLTFRLSNSQICSVPTSQNKFPFFHLWKSLLKKILSTNKWKNNFCIFIKMSEMNKSSICKLTSIHLLQFSSAAQSCPTLCEPMNRSTPGLPVHHQLPESTQTHVHRVGDAIQPSHPLSSPFPPALSLSQHQGLFQ